MAVTVSRNFAAIAFVALWACNDGNVKTVVARPDGPQPPPSTIEWHDADSGFLNGERFRVYSFDAAETGGVGSAVGAASCIEERAAGLAAKQWAEGISKDATILIVQAHGLDNMPEPRRLVELSINGLDYGALGLATGHLKAWPHEGTKPLADKPDWCG